MSQVPVVSVIVPTFNDPRLALCLRALENQDISASYEVVVVNNGPARSLTLPKDLKMNARLIEEQRTGSYNARNAGIAHARGEILAFTDSDCVPASDWLSKGVRCLRDNPQLGLVGGKIKVMPSDKPNLMECYDVATSFPQRHYVERGRFAATANMITLKRVIDDVGPFSGNLLSGGDVEWGQRVSLAGYKLAFCGDSVVVHPARESYADQIKKIQRTTAGHRDKFSGWISCLRFCFTFARPPIRVLSRVWLENEAKQTVSTRLAVSTIATLLCWYTALERLRIQFTRSASPRS